MFNFESFKILPGKANLTENEGNNPNIRRPEFMFTQSSKAQYNTFI